MLRAQKKEPESPCVAGLSGSDDQKPLHHIAHDRRGIGRADLQVQQTAPAFRARRSHDIAHRFIILQIEVLLIVTDINRMTASVHHPKKAVNVIDLFQYDCRISVHMSPFVPETGMF
jgi:hypothetical protein